MTDLIFYLPYHRTFLKINKYRNILVLFKLFTYFRSLILTIKKISITSIFNQIWAHFRIIFVLSIRNTNTNILFHISDIDTERSYTISIQFLLAEDIDS